MKPDLDEMKPFWMVYGLGQPGPTYQHDSESLVLREAERFTEVSPGTTFVILEEAQIADPSELAAPKSEAYALAVAIRAEARWRVERTEMRLLTLLVSHVSGEARRHRADHSAIGFARNSRADPHARGHVIENSLVSVRSYPCLPLNG